MTENIIVMLVAAEVMAPASVWRMAPLLCPPAAVVIFTQNPDTRQKEELRRIWRRHAEEEEEGEERRNPSERPQSKSNGTRKCPLTSAVKQPRMLSVCSSSGVEPAGGELSVWQHWLSLFCLHGNVFFL